MEGHDRTKETGTVEDAARESAAHEHPARPQQPDDGFETGYKQEPDTADEEREPNFARGVSEEPPGDDRHGRFSKGQEQRPDSPEKEVERRFSEGIERSPTSD